MFSCVWLHFKKCFKKYFLMFGCVLENTIENTFSTCCSHFLGCQTNIKYHSFLKTQTKPRKKSSNPDTSHDRDQREGEIAIGMVGASHDHDQRFAQSRS